MGARSTRLWLILSLYKQIPFAIVLEVIYYISYNFNDEQNVRTRGVFVCIYVFGVYSNGVINTYIHTVKREMAGRALYNHEPCALCTQRPYTTQHTEKNTHHRISPFPNI